MSLSMPEMLKTFKTMLQAHVLMSTFCPQVSKHVSKQSKKPYISAQQCAQKLLEEVVIRSSAAISSGFQVDLLLRCDDTPGVYFLQLQDPGTKTTDTFYLTALEARGPRSVCQ